MWKHANLPVGFGAVEIRRWKEHVMVAVHSPGPKTAMTCLQCMSGFRRLTTRIFLSVACDHDSRMTVSSHLPV